jgi:hypothetical protein
VKKPNRHWYILFDNFSLPMSIIKNLKLRLPMILLENGTRNVRIYQDALFIFFQRISTQRISTILTNLDNPRSVASYCLMMSLSSVRNHAQNNHQNFLCSTVFKLLARFYRVQKRNSLDTLRSFHELPKAAKTTLLLHSRLNTPRFHQIPHSFHIIIDNAVNVHKRHHSANGSPYPLQRFAGAKRLQEIYTLRGA